MPRRSRWRKIRMERCATPTSWRSSTASPPVLWPADSGQDIRSKSISNTHLYGGINFIESFTANKIFLSVHLSSHLTLSFILFIFLSWQKQFTANVLISFFRFSPPPAAREINIDMIEKMLKDKVSSCYEMIR